MVVSSPVAEAELEDRPGYEPDQPAGKSQAGALGVETVDEGVEPAHRRAAPARSRPASAAPGRGPLPARRRHPGSGRAVHRVLESLAGLELDGVAGGDLDVLPGLR